jgi:hypothetical protein
MSESAAALELAQVVVRGLSEGKVVEIDGLGVFYPDAASGFRFEARTRPQAFIAYVKEDEAQASELFQCLEAAGFSAWMDTRKLMAGQNWPRAIECAIETSDFFVPCYSSNSVSKWGGFQAEIRYALDCARRVPLDDIFIIPLRLDVCRVPRVLQREIQYVDLIPDSSAGVQKLVATMRRELKRWAVW